MRHVETLKNSDSSSSQTSNHSIIRKRTDVKTHKLSELLIKIRSLIPAFGNGQRFGWGEIVPEVVLLAEIRESEINLLLQAALSLV